MRCDFIGSNPMIEGILTVKFKSLIHFLNPYLRIEEIDVIIECIK